MWKITFRKGSQVKFKNIIQDINMEITELEYNKTFWYLRINKVSGINHMINKEKIRKEFYKRIRAILSAELNVKIKL